MRHRQRQECVRPTYKVCSVWLQAHGAKDCSFAQCSQEHGRNHCRSYSLPPDIPAPVRHANSRDNASETLRKYPPNCRTAHGRPAFAPLHSYRTQFRGLPHRVSLCVPYQRQVVPPVGRLHASAPGRCKDRHFEPWRRRPLSHSQDGTPQRNTHLRHTQQGRVCTTRTEAAPEPRKDIF